MKRSRSRSMGVKLMIVCGLAVLMTIPMLYVGGLIDERTQRAAEVVREISRYSGGEQTFLGPTLAVPYKPSPKTSRRDVYLFFPSLASAVVKTSTQERRRSLFQVPVFQADLKLDGAFDLPSSPSTEREGSELDWSRAEILVGVTDSRGALADATLTVNGTTVTLVPTELAPEIVFGGSDEHRLRFALLGTKIDPLAKPDARFTVSSSLRFSGAQRVAVLAYGKTTRLAAHGDWPSPSFDGGFLPVGRSVTSNGFSAEWSVPFIARGVRAEGSSNGFAALEGAALGISFIDMADPYRSVNRSTKYMLLFIGLVFLSYFVLEAVAARRIHPAQYVLVGVAQIIFYLLLLSFAERIGFDWAFLIGGAATVGLLSANAAWVFSRWIEGLKALVMLSSVYALIYLLLRMEDNALLVGAISSFIAVAVAMYLTRGIDWYTSYPGHEPPPIPLSDVRKPA